MLKSTKLFTGIYSVMNTEYSTANAFDVVSVKILLELVEGTRLDYLVTQVVEAVKKGELKTTEWLVVNPYGSGLLQDGVIEFNNKRECLEHIEYLTAE